MELLQIPYSETISIIVVIQCETRRKDDYRKLKKESDHGIFQVPIPIEYFLKILRKTSRHLDQNS